MPLGGPSFNQLISRRELDFVVSHCHGTDRTPCQRLLLSMDELVPRIWARIGRSNEPNIEELLEIIDACQEKPESFIAKAVKQSVLAALNGESADFTELNRLVRVRLAMSTLHFLEIVPNESERWTPYKKWFGNLTRDDTILTFNYDDVVERVAEFNGHAYYDATNSSSPLKLMVPAQGPALLKLHGSATWATDSDPLKVTLDKVECRRFFWPQMITLILSIKYLLERPGCQNHGTQPEYSRPFGRTQKKRLPMPTWFQSSDTACHQLTRKPEQ
jgi:hypothetical protein